MPIHPLPQFEADLRQLEEEDRKVYEALKAPSTLVVRFGSMKLVGEFPYDGAAKPGCGSKLVVRTHRGTEMGEMLTSTCPNSGCTKSVSRQDMLKYIENSGGRDYPFFTEGRVLRLATSEDLDRQAKVEQSKHGMTMAARRRVEELRLPMKMVEAEAILGGERLTFYFNSEERIDFRELARVLGQDHKTRIDLRQVGARDEARLTADYEKCGQYCCCKNFLKVLKPVSMKSAKVQKATLDPLKISGRCGRLMCCLRYEDETYETLRKKLPRKKSRVGTPEGDGTVVDTQILTQLVLVLLDAPDKEGKIAQIAVPVESLTAPISAVAPRIEPPAVSGGPGPAGGARRDFSPGDRKRPAPSGGRGPGQGGGGPPRPPERPVPPLAASNQIDEDLGDDDGPEETGGAPAGAAPQAGPGQPQGQGQGGEKRRRRRRRRRGPGDGSGGQAPSAGPGV